MLNNKKFIAIIPARGGSKRLPRKNMLPFSGKPLIQWTIEAAQKSRYIDAVVVSSDDDEILSFSESLGVLCQERPSDLASDTASTADTVSYVMGALGSLYDYIVLLQPTSPLRQSIDIDTAIEELFSREADAIVSVTEVEHSPLWSNVLPESHSLDGFIREEVLGKRSQDLATYYRLNGAVYVIDSSVFSAVRNFMPKKSYAYVMSSYNSFDIDTEVDFLCAEAIFNKISTR
ncbi:cytidylyltransferase domain-containing protein [Neptunomonas qingdaonensis]|uniref:N-acylneuraminate cytidylyltransferase/CMP-N,N'-diacetyllegionaminic acid synthase n=1 Tax=Neptunomonas qingdaonensis TaxID=1045558 RepID=A0A1I2N2Y5_9GAMM|nr:acylneuraminate cytidylyltransferase family protein [Neptunomonas qingdaonensis]SFF96077.1 N-acylneuraminate cytidylyltransferase/CMP-N,N'-diacetyllegionaminic acid synthase [Neptunomonas qingdaonensis]